MSNETKQEQRKEWADAVGVFVVAPDGAEVLMRGPGGPLIGPGLMPDLAILAAKRIVQEGSGARVVRFSVREVLFDGVPTPEDAAKLKAEAEEFNRKEKESIASALEQAAASLRKAQPEAK